MLRIKMVYQRTQDKTVRTAMALRSYILDGGLEPGTELPSENEMAEQYGVGKFCMREALRVVQSQGLVNIGRGRRTKVGELTIKPIRDLMDLALRRSKNSLLDLMEARRSLEGNIARLAALRAEPAEIQAMLETISSIDRNKDDLPGCVEKDFQFHDLLLKATRNKVFEIMLAPLAGLLREVLAETSHVAGVEGTIRGHRLILSAIVEKDPERAALCMERHLREAEEDLKKTLL